MRYFFIVLSIALILHGCAPLKIKQEQIQKIQRIGAISLIGEKMGMALSGITLSGTTLYVNEHYYRDVELDVDKKVYDFIKNHVSGEFKYVAFEYDKKLIRRAFKKLDGSGLGTGLKVEMIKSHLHEISKKYELDAIILITRGRYSVPSPSGQEIEGHHIYKRLYYGSVQTVFAFKAKYTVINLKTWKTLAINSAYCEKKIPHKYWVGEVNEIAADQLAEIHSIINEVVQKNVEYGLGIIGLIESKSESDCGIGCDEFCIWVY